MSNEILLKVLSADGSDGSEVQVEPSVFDKPCKDSIIHQVVVWQLAKRRQGSRKVKTRSEVSLSKSKPWKQKGTGRARAGSRTSPVWVGGGVAHGPTQYTCKLQVPKKVKKAALAGALTSKRQEDRLYIVSDFRSVNGKTKEMVSLLKGLRIEQSKVLIVSEGDIEPIRRASRNIPGVSVLPAGGLNVYDVLNSNVVLMDAVGLEAVQARLRS